ncbi:MAG TPA: LamG-like jellyroll fold domain-containing protein [Bacteroidota bacterium]|nr:LamG-like jellyroll fold domain-containing protein [Bacteroidota bacterium]
MKYFTCLLSVVLLALLSTGSVTAQTLDTLGGPYVVDTNTVVLLHFDGNLTNSAAAVGKTATAATPHTTIGNGITFVNNLGVAGMGQCVRINNGAITDSSFLTIPDTPTVGLQGDWTIEAWVQILTFGDNSADYRWVPRVVMKPGQDEFWHPNYWMEMWGDSRTFQTGFYTAQDVFISGTSPINMFVPGEWVHLTFIRDTQRGVIVQMVHDSNRKLKSFTSTGFDPAVNIPRTTLNPIHMGWAGGILNDIAHQSVDSWLDGYIDEIRISKVVRNFSGPPLITKTLVLPNQPTTAASYNITSTIQPFTHGATISSAMLHYYTTKWDSVPMTGGGIVLSGSIPGQAYGSLVKYYITAVDNSGFRSADPQNAESASPSYFSFYVYQPNVQTLHLTFEEGTGNPPVDHSPSNSKVIIPGVMPSYSTDAKEGTHSLALSWNTWGTTNITHADTNWVEVSSPFLSAEEFCMDAWLKPDTLVHACRVINLPGDSTDYFNNNYEFEVRTNAKGFGWVGRYSAPDGTLYQVQDTNKILVHNWYHLIWERKKITTDSGVVALVVRNASDQLEYKGVLTGVKAPLMGGSKTPPGAHLRVGRGNPNSTDWWYIPPFQGKIDDLKLYNYAAAGITAIAPGTGGTSAPGRFALYQNYPNPFNPSTRISFEIPKALQTSIVVYDMLGRKVRTVVNEEMHAGAHVAVWDGRNDSGQSVATGVYIYKLTAGTMSKSQKMMLLK